MFGRPGKDDFCLSPGDICMIEHLAELERAGGGIEARSDGDETVFSGWVPKNAVVSSDLSPDDKPSATHSSTNA